VPHEVARGGTTIALAGDMSIRNLAHEARAFGAVCAAALALGVAGCGAGFVETDGYEATYVDAPPGIEAYPYYTYNGVAVYDVGGHYYYRHGARWARYRRVPPEVSRWHEERGRAERQR